MKHFMGFSRGFTKLHTKLDADTLLNFAMHRKQNETQSQKSTRVKCMFTTWCHVTDWCNRLSEVWPWSPLSSSLTEAVTTIIAWELSDTTSHVIFHSQPCECHYQDMPHKYNNYWHLQKFVWEGYHLEIRRHVKWQMNVVMRLILFQISTEALWHNAST
jgi:hypothetical protein